MNQSEEIWALRLLILEDERLLEGLKLQESRLDTQSDAQGFRAATARGNLLSEMAMVEARLSKNRQHLAGLMT